MAFMHEIVEAYKMYNEAKENLNRIRGTYANEPDLLNFYELSAICMVERTKENLDELINEIKEN